MGGRSGIFPRVCAAGSTFTADHEIFLPTCGNGSMLDFNSPSLPPGS